MPPRSRAPNPLRNRPTIKAPPTPLELQQQAANNARLAKQKAALAAARAKARATCPNKECMIPDIVDGICNSCGAILDESNIVSEVQFGESSSGAAVVQGSFVGADQGMVRSMGPAFRKVGGGGENREATINEGRYQMNMMAGYLKIPEPTVQAGLQIFKLAAVNNFIQGRRLDMVAAVCLYSACRKEKPCRVMLIDFADKIQVNVFKLGHTFKALHHTITISAEGIHPVLPEDLIYRFAQKLEFKGLTGKVAEDAVRMVRRMSADWMTMGRRPSGVCGASLILAARMNNFRRTVTEVVYIVKVTTHTIQKRLEEFKLTASSALTVEEFLNNEFLESAHDPPSFYEKTEEYQNTKKRRKRRNQREGYSSGESDGEGEGEDGIPRPKSKTPPLRRDADGFAIPALPTPATTQSQDIPIDPQLTATPTVRATSVPLALPEPENEEQREEDDFLQSAIDDESGVSFNKLVAKFGDPDENEVHNSDEEDIIVEEEDVVEAVIQADHSLGDVPTGSKRKRGAEKGPRKNLAVAVPKEWANSEAQLTSEISEMINDPNTLEHAAHYAQAKRRVDAHMIYALSQLPSKAICMDKHIGEDEFADDIEVQNCVASKEEAEAKEKIWVNHNKGWLRKQQLKLWQRRQAELGPPKAKRNRKRKARIGEGQTEAAASPGDAAVTALKRTALSKKINYDAFARIFDNIPRGEDGGLGSAGTSRGPSRAGSEYPESETGSQVTMEEMAAREDLFTSAKGKSRGRRERSVVGEGRTTYRNIAPSPAPSDMGSDYRTPTPQPDLAHVILPTKLQKTALSSSNTTSQTKAKDTDSIMGDDVDEEEEEEEEEPKRKVWKEGDPIEDFEDEEEEDYYADDFGNGDVELDFDRDGRDGGDEEAWKGAEDEPDEWDGEDGGLGLEGGY